IDDHIDRHPQLKKDRELMASIPGVGAVISRIMLSLIHSRSFTQARQVSAFVGLVPRIQESGQWKGRSRLSKQGPAKIRAKLYMAAIACAQWNPDIKAQYQRLLANGKSKMQALGAAMRKLVQICFGGVKHQSEYAGAVGNREEQHGGAGGGYAQAGPDLLWCCKTSEGIPPTGGGLGCCGRAGEMVSTWPAWPRELVPAQWGRPADEKIR